LFVGVLSVLMSQTVLSEALTKGSPGLSSID
jgi:hypothetical protein